jgi:DNA-binding protein H-NS
MSATFNELQQQIAQLKEQITALEQQSEIVRLEEVKVTAERIKKMMADQGITPEDLGITVSPRKKYKTSSIPKAKPKNLPKYRDDEGNEWTGRGRPPTWIKNDDDKERFRIESPTEDVEAVEEKEVSQ